jgi:hypothetical protein
MAGLFSGMFPMLAKIAAISEDLTVGGVMFYICSL